MIEPLKREIGFRHWNAPAPKAVFLLVHGLGTYSGRWEEAAEFFLKNGISSYAIDLENPNQPDDPGRKDGYIARYRKDILHLYNKAADDNPGKKIFIIGESMGGLISFLLAADHRALFEGLICISPAFANRIKVTPSDYLKIGLSFFYDSKAAIKIPFNSSMCTRDMKWRKKLDTDPNEYKSAPARFLLEIVLAQFGAGILKGKLQSPVLFLIAGEDKIADSSAAKKIFNSLSVKDKQLVEFPGMYHALSIDLGRDKVFEEILRWAGKRL